MRLVRRSSPLTCVVFRWQDPASKAPLRSQSGRPLEPRRPRRRPSIAAFRWMLS